MKLWLLLSALLFALPVQAQFDISGEGSVFLVNGTTQQFDFGFSLFRQDGSYRFIVGRYNLDVPTVPQKYSLALILQDDKHVWVPDFINEPLLGFELKIEQYHIKLFQDPKSDAKGHFIVQLNDERFQFSRGPGQVSFLFNDNGIKEVRVDGMFKPQR
ncbi:hypothetical protein [Rheinheimera sp.]|uniref:hypothetical protein n=1 Tax=Rheinheimera sp. TaxID=1869214 RepID=UPI0040472D62